METHLLVRMLWAVVISLALAFHGKRKKSLSNSGALAAIFVGFVSFATSYRFGTMLILFYYTGSKFTKIKEEIKARLEDGHLKGGQRNYVHVFANSIAATVVAVTFYVCVGEDVGVNFGGSKSGSSSSSDVTDLITLGIAGVTGTFQISKHLLASHLSCMYCAHYACAAGDTWASELGVLAKSPPRLVTSLFLRTVPPGTNGGMSALGTTASAAGGLFIGAVSYAFFLNDNSNSNFNLWNFLSSSSSSSSSSLSSSTVLSGAGAAPAQYPMILFGLLCGLIGSLFDSLLGATLQASYYSKDRKCIVKEAPSSLCSDKSIVSLSGVNVLSNEAVNFLSIVMTMAVSIYLGPWVFCLCDSSQCS